MRHQPLPSRMMCRRKPSGFYENRKKNWWGQFHWFIKNRSVKYEFFKKLK
jgi:hypothetical protein